MNPKCVFGTGFFMVLQAIVVSIYELTKFNARTGLPLLEPFNKNIPFAGFIPPPTAAGIYPEKWDHFRYNTYQCGDEHLHARLNHASIQRGCHPLTRDPSPPPFLWVVKPIYLATFDDQKPRTDRQPHA